MTDKQLASLLRSCRADLKLTREGYVTHPNGPRWRAALPKLDKAIAELSRPPVPALGPVLEQGLAMLLLSPTHITSGVGYPAFDTGFGQAGRWMIAPETITVTKDSSAQGGDAFYAKGASGLLYWIGHITKAPAVGAKFAKGRRVAQIANIAKSDGGPHLHVGVDARPLIGQHLLWGASGNGPPYTYGAPTIGAQLARENL